MVLAEFVYFKHGLRKSCGIECFEGIMLEPCLPQPCFHAATLLSQWSVEVIRNSARIKVEIMIIIMIMRRI